MSKLLLASLSLLTVGFTSFATGFLVALKGSATTEMTTTMTAHLVITGAMLLFAGSSIMIVAWWSGVEVIDEIGALILRARKAVRKGVEVSKEFFWKVVRIAKAVAIDSVTKAPGRTGMAFVLAGIAFIVMAIIAENRDFAVRVAAFIGIVALALGAMTITAAYLGKDAENSA